MDSLFLMQRYWGSDEDEKNDEEEEMEISNFCPAKEKLKLSTGKEKSDIPIIDIDSNENSSLSNKRKKLNSSDTGINSTGNDSDSSDSKQQAGSSASDSEIEILNDIPYSSTYKNIQNKINDLKKVITANDKISPKAIKNLKLKNGKPLKNGKKSTSRECNESNVVVEHINLNEDKNNNTFNLDEAVDTSKKIVSKTVKKPKVNGIELQENSNSASLDCETDSKIMENGIILPKSKRHKSSLNEINDINKNIESKIVGKKNQKDTKLDGKTKETVSEKYESSKSEETENTDQTFCTIGQIYQQKDVAVKHALPFWLSNPTYISVNLQEKEIPISELSYLDSNTKSNLINAGINFLFPVQLAVIPWLIQSKEQSILIRPSDICVSAPTGSGKTLAFVLPIIQSLKDRVVCAIRALVVLPVSELAIQVFKVFETFVQGTDLKVALLTGKKSFISEQNSLVKSNGQSVQSLVDIVVTTPGRIHDHIYRTKGFCLKRLRYLVIDEADQMMNEIQQGWLKQVEDAVFNDCIFSDCVCSSYKRTFYEPTSAYNFGYISQPLQKLLYSATLTHNPAQLHSLSLYKPKLFTSSATSLQEYKGSCPVPSSLTMLQVLCEEGIKPMVICHLVKHHNFRKVLCFTETVERAHRLHLVLEAMGLLQVREVSSFNRTVQRKIVLEQFSSGKVQILVCSDLVARGIDIEDIDCVISYDVPQYVKTYIHRIGRTARAGKTGKAITLLSAGEIPHFKRMLNPAEIKLPEEITINPEDLKPLVNSYQTALSVTDAKLKNEKNHFPGRSSKKIKRKHE